MRERTYSSHTILTAVVAAFILLMGTTTIVLAVRNPHPVTVSFGKPGAQRSAVAHIAYQGQDGKSALELLKSHVSVTTRQSSYGEYVNSIDGVNAGKNGTYWALYINGKSVPVVSGNVLTHTGDNVEWRLE